MRILKINGNRKPDSFKINCSLSVVNENGENLQGTINIEELDEVILPPIYDFKKEKYNGGYFVFNPAESKPKKIYETYEEAYRDAREVAGRYTEAKVYVLQIISEIQRESYTKTIITDKEGNISETFDNDKVPF